MNDCTDVRTSLGVYVVGALDPGERSRLEEHLERCPACRDELAGLAGLPAMLGRVELQQLDRVAGPPVELLDGLLARAAERRRGWLGRTAGGRGIGGWAPLAAAACLLLVVGGLFGGFVLPRGSDGGTAQAPPSATAEPRASAERISAANPETNIKGYVVLRKKAWGTEVELHLAGVQKV
jgi:anti-sigma factor RsiW